MCSIRLHMWTKSSDNWLQTAICIAENVTISFKHEYDVISDVIDIKSTVLGFILDDLSISNVKMNLSKPFWKFLNGRHFVVRANFKPEVVPEVESYITTGHATPYILSFCSML